MRIRLILPTTSAPVGSPLDFRYITRLVKGQKGPGCIPLALPTLAALTPPDVEVAITDENVELVDLDERPDVVGISYITASAPRAYAIADAFRARGVFVILGGFHASQFPDEALEHADSVAIGEAEDTWPRFVEDARAGNAGRRYACERMPDLQRLVVPRWDCVRADRYYYFHVQASRGCRFDCDFCQVREIQGRDRYKPVDNVLREIGVIRRINRTPGRDAVTFADDNIVSDRRYALELFRGLASLNVSWTSQCSLTIAQDEELLDQAARSGCSGLFIGFESICQESLDGVNKGKMNRVEAYPTAIERIRARGINVFGSFVLGFDPEDPDVFRRTLAFIDEARITFPIFHVLTPIPGTRLHARLEREGRILHHRWEEYNGGSVCFRPKGMTPEQLQRGYYWISRQAYGREATLGRIDRLWRAGALRGASKQYLLRALISLRLLAVALRETEHRGELRSFVRAMLRELWRRDGIAMGPLGVYLSLFEYSRGLPDVEPPDQADFSKTNTL